MECKVGPRLPSEALDQGDGHGVMGPVVGVVHEAVAVVVNAPSWLSCPYRNLWVALSCTPFVVLVVEAVVEVVRIAYLNLSLLAFAVLPLAAHAAASAGGSCWPPHKVAISQCQLQKCHNGHSAKKHLADAVRFKSINSRTTVCLIFGHRSLIPHLTIFVLFLMVKLTLLPKKGTRSLCRGVSWMKRRGQ